MTRDDFERLTLGPLAACLGGIELLQQLQAFERFGKHQRVVLGRPGRQPWTAFDQAGQRVAFVPEVAPRLDMLAVAACEHRRAALAGFETDARVDDGLDQDCGREPRLEGFEPNPGFGIRLHFLSTRHRARIALHPNLRDECRYSLQEPRLAIRGNLEPLRGNHVEQAPVVGGETGDLDPVVGGQRDAVFAFRIPAVGIDGNDDEAIGTFVDVQFRFPSDHVDRFARVVEDIGMAGQRVEAANTEFVVDASPGTADHDGGGSGEILFAEVVHGRRLLGQAFEGNPAPLAPRPVFVPALLARSDVDVVVVPMDIPDEPFLHGCRRRALRLALVTGVVGQLLQCLERAFPGEHGFFEHRQGLDAELVEPRLWIG